MKRGLLLLLSAFLTMTSFAQYTVKMSAQEYEGKQYYQGELVINGGSFVPEVNAAYEIGVTNLVSSDFIGELRVNIVDRSSNVMFWKELNPEYAIVGTQITKDESVTNTTKMYVTQTGTVPENGQYSLVFQAWKKLEGVEEITLTIDDISLMGTVSMYIDGYTDKGINLQVGGSYDIKSKIRFSQFEDMGNGEYPTYESDNLSVATVDANGVVRAVAPGTAKVTTKIRGKLLVDAGSYTKGTTLIMTKEMTIYVRPVPTISLAWNEYGTNVEGIGYVGESDYWQYSEVAKISSALEDYVPGYSSMWTPAVDDKFTIQLKGTSNISGYLELGLVDEREAVGYWGELSEFEKNLAITAGEEFDFTVELAIDSLQNLAGVPYANPVLIFAFVPTIGSCAGIENAIELNLETYDVTYAPKEETNEPIVPETEYVFCKGATATALVATAKKNATLNWYDSEKVALASAPIPSTEVSGIQYYYVSQTLNEVESELVEIMVTVGDKLATPTVDMTEQTVCAGTPVTFTVTSDGPVAWINSSNYIVTTDKTLSQREMSAGVRTFGVYATSTENTCGSDTVFVTLTLKENPTVYIDGKSVVKEGESVSLTAKASSQSSTIASYEWKVGGVESEEETATITTSLARSTTFMVTVTDVASCTATAQKYVAVSVDGEPMAAFADDTYTVEIGGTLTIQPTYYAINDFSNLTFLLKEYNGCVQFTPQVDGSCKVTGLLEGTDSLIINLTYSDGTNTYQFIDSCRINVVPSDKVAKPYVETLEYVYCQMAPAVMITAQADALATLQWYIKQDNGLFAKLYSDPLPATDYPHEEHYAVSQVIDGLEGPKEFISVLVKQKPTVTCELVESAATRDVVALEITSDIGTSYVWSIDGVEYSTEQSTTAIFTEARDYQIKVVTTADNGCTDYQDRIITVYKKVPDPEVETTSYEVCQGDENFTLSAVATEDAQLIWYNDAEEVLESAPTITTTDVLEETYYVSQINEDLEESDKIAITVVVKQKPTVSFELVEEASNEDEVSLSATSDIATSFVWSVDGEELSSNQSTTNTFTEVKDYKVSVVATADNGCSNSQEKTITIYKKVELPTVEKTSYEVCQGDEGFTLSATAEEGNQLIWYDAENEVLASAPTIATDNILEGTYYVSQKDANSHEGEKVTISVVVKQKPTVSFELVENAEAGEEVALSATSDIATSFVWSVDGVEYSTNQTDTKTFTDANDYKVSVVATADNGCAVSDEKTITIYKKVVAPTVEKTSYVVCQGDASFTLSATAEEGNQLVWYDSKEEVLESAPIITTDNVLDETYYVSQKNEYMKEGEKVAISVVVKQTPVLTFAPQEVVYAGSLVELQATSDIPADFEWSTGDSEQSVTVSHSSITFEKPETQIIEVQATANGCTAKSAVGIKAKKVPTITFAEESTTIFVGETANLQPTFDGLIAGATVTWSVDNSEIASVESQETGVVKALAVGETMVTYSTEYTDPDTKITDTYSASYKLIVSKFLETVECKDTDVEMFEGENFFADAIVHTEKGASTNYHLEVSAEDSLKVELVDKMLTAVEQGNVTLYVVSDEKSDLRSAINIKINEFIPAKEISLPKQITISVGADTTLVASVIPANASYAEVAFLEKEDDVVSVTADGKVVGKSAGTSIVTASTKEGIQAQTLVYVTSSDEEIVKIRLNNGEESIYLKVGESKTVSCQVSPTTIKANDLKWSPSDAEVATVSPSGILTAIKEGEMFLYISYKTSIDEKIKVFVTKSNAPTISYIPDITMQQSGSNVSIDLRNYISDDVTEFDQLKLAASGNDEINVSVEDGIATLSLQNETFIGMSEIVFSAMDDEKLLTTRSVKVQVDAKPNEAPNIVVDTIVVPFGKNVQLTIADFASDDYTMSSELKFMFDYDGENILVNKWKNTYLRIQAAESDWSGKDVISMSFTDGDGLTTQKDVVVIVQAAENKAPVIAEIPQQNEIGDELFPNIDLSKYVTDDYTSPSSIVWSASTSENVSVKFSGCYAEIADLNEYWRGAEVITFTAMDQGGLTSSIDVTFYRMTETSETETEFGWYGKPTVNIIVSRYNGTPKDEFTLIGTFYGSNCSGEWVIGNKELKDPNALIQNVTFDETGYYDVTFNVQYGEGEITSLYEKLSVYGVEERNPSLCIGDSKTLTATDGVDSYLWSNGETTQSITVDPKETTEYTLTMKKGLTTLNDTVTVRVSIPVKLPKDSVMCAGTTYELEAIGEYVSYKWNTEETSKSIVIPAEEKTYTVETLDEIGCTSSASFAVTKVNDLPAIDLGEDRTMCDKETLTLTAPEGMKSYQWDNLINNGTEVNSTESSIELTKSAVVAVAIVDNNMCENADTVEVTFTYPYPEEIGVITFSESSKNIIVAWERTADVNTDKYQVQRQSTNNEWENVGEEVPFSEFGIVVDEATNYESRGYKYRLVTTDGCGNQAYSGEYRSSFLQPVTTTEGKFGVNWWTYQSPREGNVVGSYLLRKTDSELKADDVIEGYEILDKFSSEDDYIGWTDTEGLLKAGDVVRVAFELDKTVYENAIKDKDGEIIEYQNLKSESGPFAIAISNIAEVESTEAILDLFPADVVVFPTVIEDNIINVGIVSNDFKNFTIAVVDVNGKAITTTQTGDITKALVQIPTDSMKQGSYVVNISVDGKTKSVKVLK